MGFLLAEDIEHPFDLPLGDDLPEPDFLRVVNRNHQGEVAVRQSELEVGLAFPEHLALHKVFDDSCAVVRIDDLVSLGEHSSPSGRTSG